MTLLAEGVPVRLALTDDAVVWLDRGEDSCDFEPDDSDEKSPEDERARPRPHRVVWTPKTGGESRTLAARARRAWNVAATEHFAFFTEETDKRYVMAAFVVGLAGGEVRPQPFERRSFRRAGWARRSSPRARSSCSSSSRLARPANS